MDYSGLQGSMFYLFGLFEPKPRGAVKERKLFRVNEVIVIFVVHLDLRKSKSGGNIILSI